MKKAIISIFFASLLTIPFVSSRADTLILYEGSVLSGKIISDDDDRVHLKNYHGTFKIKKSRIDDIYRTSSYKEDIALLRRLNLPFKEDEIRLNVLAGQGTLAARPTEEKAPEIEEPKAIETAPEPAVEKNRRTWGRISLSGSFLDDPASSGSDRPYGYAGHVALDFGIVVPPRGAYPLIPGLRIEGTYLRLKKSSLSLSGFLSGAGPIWSIPSMKNNRGSFIFALIPGASFFEAGTTGPFPGGSARHGGVNFAIQAIGGFQKSFGPVSIFLHARYLRVFGKGSDFFSVGGEAGIGINAW